jgi:hypothetical protein
MIFYFLVPLGFLSFDLQQITAYKFYGGDPENKYALGKINS